MDINILLSLLAGLLIGAFLTFLITKAKLTYMENQLQRYEKDLSEKQTQLQNANESLNSSIATKARLEEQAAHLSEAQEQIADLRTENTSLHEQVATLAAEKNHSGEKLNWISSAQEQLRETFQALASQTLQNNATQFMNEAQGQLAKVVAELRGDWNSQKGQIQSIVEPLDKGLQQMDDHIRALEQRRQGAYSELQEQLRQLSQTNQELRSSTSNLSHALRSSGTRGKWGELQLKRVVELAGMVRHVDFEEQASIEEVRPDMIIHLPNGGSLPVDAKVPMDAYLESLEARDDQTRAAKMQRYCQAVRDRVRALGQKRYWEQFERAPEFVIMFVPNESCLCAAFEHDPSILEYALQQSVLPTTPVTLLAVLKAVAYGWQQQQTAENARMIAEECRELYKRVKTFMDHLSKLRTNLNQTVDNFNETVGSLHGRLLPSVRKIKDMANIESDLPDVRQLDTPVRTVLQPEEQLLDLSDSAEPSA